MTHDSEYGIGGSRPASRQVRPAVPVPWILSGPGLAGLRARAAQVRDFVADHAEYGIEEIGLSLALDGGTADAADGAGSMRAALVAADRDAFLGQLDVLAQGGTGPGVVTGKPAGDQRVVFVFPGHGGQWAGMARELRESSAVFRETMRRCVEAITPFIDWSLDDVLNDVPGAPGLDRVDVAQPALFAMMVSLAAMWRSHGVVPAAIVGQSVGEIAAVTVAGGLSLTDGAHLVAVWSQAEARLQGRGDVAAVSLPAGQVRERIARRGGQLDLAGINGPRSVLVSGDSRAVEELLLELAAEGVRARKVPMGSPSHSRQMDEVEEFLLDNLRFLAPRAARVPCYSSTTGGEVDTARLDAAYWYRNLRQTMRFDSAIRELTESGHRLFVEVSPHPVLTLAVQEIAADQGIDARALDTIRRGEGSLSRYLLALSRLHVCGPRPDWRTVFAGVEVKGLKLPASVTTLVPGSAQGDGDTSWAGQVLSMSAWERERHLLALVTALTADVTGTRQGGELPSGRDFKALGLDSIGALELRNRLSEATGLKLPATIVFDHPTPASLAGRLRAEVLGEET
ncbi:MAG TPA: acyltransferase domain-containing protein, partial [Trebonia sp.]|nr:acyltransferase domain-containing protein [Trebonia sp.]